MRFLVLSLLFALCGCGADMRRNQPALSLTSYRALDDTAKCLIPEMEYGSPQSHEFNIAVLKHGSRCRKSIARNGKIGKVYEIGPVLPLHATWCTSLD